MLFEGADSRNSAVRRKHRYTMSLQATRKPVRADARTGKAGPAFTTSRSPVITGTVLNALSRTPTAIRPPSRHGQRA